MATSLKSLGQVKHQSSSLMSILDRLETKFVVSMNPETLEPVNDDNDVIREPFIDVVADFLAIKISYRLMQMKSGDGPPDGFHLLLRSNISDQSVDSAGEKELIKAILLDCMRKMELKLNILETELIRGLIYFERFADKGSANEVTIQNFGMVFLMSIMLAHKVNIDGRFYNSWWSEALGIPLCHLNQSEECFLGILQFDISISETEISEMITAVKDFIFH